MIPNQIIRKAIYKKLQRLKRIKIFSKNGKLIAEAGPQKKVTKEIVQAEKVREKQIIAAKNEKEEMLKKI